MMHENMSSPPVREEGTFDPKKLGRLAQARRAMSMESELTRSSRWNLPTSPPMKRAISLDERKPAASSIDISSLRTLGSSPSKRSGRQPSMGHGGAQDLTTRGVTRTFAGAASSTEEISQSGRSKDEKKQSSEPLIAACNSQCEKQTSSKQAGSDSHARVVESTKHQRAKRPFSICTGVGDSAIAALSELARRRRDETPAIRLPSNKPFLVGEHANRMHQVASTGTTTLRPSQDAKSGVLHGELADSGSIKDATTTIIRKEAPNITLLSKLLFFGGTTPSRKESSTTSNQSTPEAVLLSPVSQSDSCDDIKNSYLLQLSHIMGEASIEKQPLQPRPQDLDETSSTTSSLDYYSSAPLPVQHENCSTQRFSGTRRFLLLVIFVVIGSFAVSENEWAFVAYNQTTMISKSAVPLARESYSAALRRAEKLTVEAQEKVWKQLNVQMSRTIDWVDGSVASKEALSRLQRAQQLTIRAYSIAMDFILDPTLPPEDILGNTNRYTPTESLDEVLAAASMVAMHIDDDSSPFMQSTDEPTLQAMALLRSPSEDNSYPSSVESLSDNFRRDMEGVGETEVDSTATRAKTKAIASLLSASTGVPSEFKSSNEVRDHYNDDINDDTITSDDKTTHQHTVATATDEIPFESKIEAVALTIPAETMTASELLDESDSETSIADGMDGRLPAEGAHVSGEAERYVHTAKDRLQAAASEDLQQAMGRRVMKRLASEGKSSFTLSLTAQAGIRKREEHQNRTAPHAYQLSSTPPRSRKAIGSTISGLHQRAFFDESFSCSSIMVVGRSICRVFEPHGDEESVKVLQKDYSEKEEADEFLQKPLNEIVGDFFRDRWRRKREAKERKNRSKGG